MATESSETGHAEAGAPARELLLERAVDFLVGRGLGDISLRELATALGTSHRMLLYHFGSKERLFVEVVKTSERRQQVVLAGMYDASDGTLEDATRQFWRRLRSPELAAHERLFFEVYGQALQGREYAQCLLDGVIDDWVEPAAAGLIAQGIAPEIARADARLGLAIVRGLLLDMLATGDVDGVDAAFERYLEYANFGPPPPD
jgi:AcrR family transcriptional regulator